MGTEVFHLSWKLFPRAEARGQGLPLVEVPVMF
jgi:hypothetical protein